MSTSLAPKWAQHLAPGVVRVLFFTVACAAALSLRAGTTLEGGVLTFDTSDGKSLSLQYANGTIVIFR